MDTVSAPKSSKIHKNVFALKPIAFFIMLVVCTPTAVAQSDFNEVEIANLDRYAVIVGLACACGLEYKDERNKVADWLVKKMEDGYPDRLRKFLDNYILHCEISRYQKSPIICNAVAVLFSTTDFDSP